MLLFFCLFFLETVDDHEVADDKSENNDGSDEKDDLRISQPKYSQLLKELDFSRARMVHQTDLFLLCLNLFCSSI